MVSLSTSILQIVPGNHFPNTCSPVHKGETLSPILKPGESLAPLLLAPLAPPSLSSSSGSGLAVVTDLLVAAAALRVVAEALRVAVALIVNVCYH